MRLEPPTGDAAVEEMIQRREAARKKKAWDVADDLRLKLKEMGVDVIDTKEGPVWRRN